MINVNFEYSISPICFFTVESS